MGAEAAAYLAKQNSGGSEISDELLCAAEDLMPFDPWRHLHPASFIDQKIVTRTTSERGTFL